MRHHSLVLVASLCTAAPSARAQIQTYAVEGDAGFRPGAVVSWVGDVDADGRPDWATAQPTFTAAGSLTNAGAVRVHSGATGLLLAQLEGTAVNDRLGSRIAELGDVDGDGAPEFLVTSGPTSPGTRVLAISPATWTPVLTVVLATDELSNLSLSGLGDVDADGVPDFAAGDPSFAMGDGAVWVHSGASGALLHALPSPYFDGQFGRDVTGPGDLDGDGRAEILVGAPYAVLLTHYYRGAAVVLRGSDGSVLRAHLGGQGDGAGYTVEELGGGVIGVGDVDLDGVPDYAAQSQWPGTQALLFSGASGVLLNLYKHMGYPVGSYDLAAAGDVDGDGITDLLIGGASLADTSEIHLRSGAPPYGLIDTLWTPFLAGRFVAGQDADGDGNPDLLLGEANFVDSTGVLKHYPGRTSLLGLHDLTAEARRDCTTTPNSTGESAHLWPDGSLSFADDALAMQSWNLPPGNVALVYLGTASASVPFGNGIRCVGGQTLRLSPGVASADGVLETPVSLDPSGLPATLLQPGAPAWFQCWFRDPAGGGLGFDFSDSVRVTLVP
jgi:hypothetical protein